MKKRNLIHFIECLVLMPLFLLLAFYMRLQNDLFFTLTLTFGCIAAAMLIVYLYVVGDSDKPHLCKLIPLDISDLIFLYFISQIGVSSVFLVIRNLSGFSPWTALAVYLLLLAVTVLLMTLPAPAEPPAPAADNETDDVSEKNLRYYSNYLQRLCRKCQYSPLNTVMTEISGLLIRLDPAFSVQLQTLEDDVSSKCVKIENALLTGDHAKLPMLTREMESTLGYIRKRIDDYRYTLNDEGFYTVNDEIAMAQIDHLLDKLGLEYEEDLATAAEPFEDQFFYRKAMKFASEEYQALIAGYNRQVVDRLAEEENARLIRRDHRMRYLRRFSHLLTCLLIVCCATLPLLWHLQIRPQGFQYTVEEGTGYIIITDYNPFYGEDLVIPAKLNGKKVIAVGEDALIDSSITSLTLEEGVERLDYQSIRDNPELNTLNLPRSLKYIGNFATYKLPLKTVNYAGTEQEWTAVKIEPNGNNPIKTITVNFEK